MTDYLGFGTAGASGYSINWGSGYRLRESAFSSELGAGLTALQLDLLDIAMAVHAQDRLVKRPAAWHRSLGPRIAVREPDFWREPQIFGTLTQLLHWLTDDTWELEFLGGRDPFRSDVGQMTLFRRDLRDRVRVGLFSGGLDSFAGAARDIRDFDGDLVLVALTGNSQLTSLQRQAASALAPLTVDARPPRLVQARANLTKEMVREITGKREAPESSQRTRAFLFLAAGAVGALAAGVHELRVYENGIGALSLPLTEAQLGAHNTRAMRPETLRLAASLFSFVSVADGGQRFEVVNPSFLLTKARLCETLPTEMVQTIALTVSCDTGLTSRTSSRWCGVCTSCLLRRQGLRAAGLVAADEFESDRYRVDIFDHGNIAGDKPEFRDMLDQASRVDAALRDSDSDRALMRAFPDLRTVLPALSAQGYADPRAITRRLLAAYVDEWRLFGHSLVERYLDAPPDVERFLRLAA